MTGAIGIVAVVVTYLAVGVTALVVLRRLDAAHKNDWHDELHEHVLVGLIVVFWPMLALSAGLIGVIAAAGWLVNKAAP